MTTSCHAPARAELTALDVLGTDPKDHIILDDIRTDGASAIKAILAPSRFHGYCFVCVQVANEVALNQQSMSTESLFSKTLPMSTSMDTIREIAHRLVMDIRTRHVNVPRSAKHGCHVLNHSPSE